MVESDRIGAGFAGFPPDFDAFFRDLAAEQNRDWFQANRDRYERAVREPLREFVVATSAALGRAGVPLQGDPKRSVSRINRDVRFSADKSPYKTYAALTFTRVPGEMSPGLLYVHLAPDERFAVIGFYAADPADLARFRSAIASRQDEWREIVRALDRAGHPLEAGEALKRMPKGFEPHADSPVAEHLKLKAHVAKLRLQPDELGGDLPGRVAAFAAACEPLLHFGWAALG